MPVRAHKQTLSRIAATLAAASALVLAQLTSAAAPAQAASTNPIAGPWGVYTGAADGVYPAYQSATGTQKYLLSKVARKARVRWFTSAIARSDIRAKVHDYVVQTQNGNPNVVVMMAIFRLWPKGERNKSIPLSAADQQAYRDWVDAAARGIGSARVALMLEPDLAVAYNGWQPSVRFNLAKYAARTFSALPRTSVYIDGGAADWLTPTKAASMLRAAGVGLPRVRGYALNATHYTSTPSNIVHGRQIASTLATAGITSKHFVVNTADTGQPFTWSQYWSAHPNGSFDNAETCATKSSHRCVTLGAPPTWDVAHSPQQLSPSVRTMALRFCDGYVWLGRPWLTNQASPFNMQRTLQIARTTPF